MHLSRPSRVSVVAIGVALLAAACSNGDTPEVADVVASPTAAATANPSPEPSPEPSPSPSPEPEPSPSPCPEGEQRLVPGGDCFEPSPQPSPEPEPEPEPEETETQASDPEPEPTETETSEPAPGPCDREARTFTITATNFAFDPGSLGEVCVGDTIVMQNEGGTHTLKETEGSAQETGSTGSGESASLTVQDAGSYDFFCGFHPQQMRTSVSVPG